MRSQTHSWNLYVIMPITFMCLAACQPFETRTPSIAIASPTAQIFTSASYIVARSIEELTRKSTLVVTGWAIERENVINMARNIDDISKPDTTLFGIGQIYQFKIDQILKGGETIGDDKVINILQPEGLFKITPGVPVTELDMEKGRSQYQFISIRLDSKYLLFLEPLIGFNDLKNHFTGASQPWRFDISNPDKIFTESPWSEASQYFPLQSWADVITGIDNPQDQRDLPYPAPSPYP
jgi:hypothetical protein